MNRGRFLIEIKADIVIDTKYEISPMPVLKAKKAIDEMNSGQLLKVVSMDPGSSSDMLSWCKSTGNELVYLACDGRKSVYYIRKK
ncbi:MAG: sulfurtransferase TusA family protein [Rubrobacteridae bacterium]|nr:sulfurtransferase TusA family protein [Rubrobacteridae bacterium]